MASISDPQKRPVYHDRTNNRFLSEPVGAGPWPVVNLDLSSLGAFSANTWLGRYGTNGVLQSYGADVAIDLINTATASTISAARIVAGSTAGPGVLQLTDATNSTSTTTAATPNSVKSAYDLAGEAQATASAALPKSGGTMSGAITFAAGQTFADANGSFRILPQQSKSGAYVLATTDTGQHISITTGGVTVPAGVFNAGAIVTVYNNSNSSQVVTQGASAILRQAGTSGTGNRTLAQYGIATILCVGSDTFVISGSGIS